MLLVVFCSLLPAPALADRTKTRARQLLSRGNAAFVNGKLKKALALYRKARSLYPLPGILVRMGTIRERLGQGAAAYGCYRRYLVGVRRGQDPARHEKAVAGLVRLRKKIALVKLEVKQGGVEISIDGKSLGRTPLSEIDLPVDAGKHVFVARKEGHVSVRREVVVVGGDSTTVALALGAAIKKDPVVGHSAPPTSARVRSRPQAPTRPPSRLQPGAGDAAPASRGRIKHGSSPRRIWTWVSAGTAVALAIAGAALYGSAYGDLEEYQETRDQDRFKELERTISGRATGSHVMFGLAGALAATSVVLFFFEGRVTAAQPRERPPSHHALSIRPGPGAGLLLTVQY